MKPIKIVLLQKTSRCWDRKQIELIISAFINGKQVNLEISRTPLITKISFLPEISTFDTYNYVHRFTSVGQYVI